MVPKAEDPEVPAVVEKVRAPLRPLPVALTTMDRDPLLLPEDLVERVMRVGET